MASDFSYLLVHLKFTIPPAIVLSLIYRPLTTPRCIYKVAFLIAIAVVSTIPWDGFLIRRGIWSYPPAAVWGPKLNGIPLEEVFFFVIQTYNTSLLYLLFSKPTLHATYLVKERKGDNWKFVKAGGQLALALVCKKSLDWIRTNGERTYLGLITIWAAPFLLLLWSLGYQLLCRLPLSNTLLPIALPTVYLWIVDSLALHRGTWVISDGTKTGIYVWPFGLEIEEAIFFLVTNILIVFGLVAFDNALAIMDAFPAHFRKVPELPSPALLVRALLMPSAAYDDDRILGLQEAVTILQNKSRSFYLASGTFSGRLRIDLILLYSFCRVADDLIDNAKTVKEAREWEKKLRTFLQLSYGADDVSNGNVIKAKDVNQGSVVRYVVENFPPDTHLSLMLLPTHILDKEPLFELLEGFKMDLLFAENQSPIKSEADLDLYGARVAGCVGLSCIQLVLHHYPGTTVAQAKRLMAAGHDMGIALQYINIARDLSVDADIGRCYVPPAWLKKEKLTVESFLSALKKPGDEFLAKKVEIIRLRLLDRAFEFYGRSVDAIEELPRQARAPMRVAVESYVQIGRELRRPGIRIAGRASVPLVKRLAVAYRSLSR